MSRITSAQDFVDHMATYRVLKMLNLDPATVSFKLSQESIGKRLCIGASHDYDENDNARMSFVDGSVAVRYGRRWLAT